ncbi:MAG: GNAT family N-acetyltransferase [Chloroflexi bacterium]|nr:GNAT family N-acetyltransferase [Chloroflexota bacterium]
MRIRQATLGDAARIAEIRVTAWRATYTGIVPESILDALDVARNAAWLTRRLEDPGTTATLVAEEGGAVVGYVLLSPAHDPDADGLGEVEAIYLDPSATGRGLGRALLGAAIARLVEAGHPAVVLWVLTDNGPARRFYEREGFVLDGTARMLDFDGTPIEEVRYRRSIA